MTVTMTMCFISDLWSMRPNRQLGLYADIHERKIQAYATPLRELTCHMGSHSVTCHPTAGTRLSYPGGMQG